MKSKKSHIIRVKHPQLRCFRATSRLVLRAAYNSYHKNLLEQASKIRNNSNLSSAKKEKIEKKIYDKISLLNEAYREAPLGCGVCGTQAIKDDLLYSEYDHEWYCESCYGLNRAYYKKNPHPWLPSWKRLYP